MISPSKAGGKRYSHSASAAHFLPQACERHGVGEYLSRPMCSNAGACAAGWAEILPPGCPSTDAPERPGRYYRAVTHVPPVAADFYSYRRLYPQQFFKVGECLARGISVFESLSDCEKMLKLPNLRGRLLVSIDIPSDGGAIQKTGSVGHFSWWRCAAFDPGAHCSPVDSA